MPLHPVLRVVNSILMLIVICGLGAIYWLFWRPLPKTSGATRAPVLAEVRIDRDDRGVPHIRAQSIEDAIFAQGFATAQDRLWQMDALRRIAAGELSEVVGRAALESDTRARKLRLRRIAESSVMKLTPTERALLGAYTRGVNYCIDSQRGSLPVEFVALGYQPRPWRMSDTLLAGLEMYRILTTTWDDDLERLQMLEGGDAEKAKILYPAWTGKEIFPGSNAWVVSGKHTASGKPILANDPHLGFSLPSTWYMVHVQAPGLNVAGATLPGVPGVLSGHNENIAWGVTNLGFDVQDLYIEQIDLRSGRYMHQGQVRQAVLEREWIAVKGERPAQIATWVTNHGPIFTAAGSRHMALKWTAAEHGMKFPFLNLNRARNWQEFREALRDFAGPGQNFVYADREGNIGYQATGWLPLRRTFEGGYPLDGASGTQEWDGVVPYDEMPSSFNPPSGRIVSANQNVFRPGSPYGVSGQFAPGYRQRQIDDLLRAKRGWKPEDMLAVQKDVYSAYSAFLVRQAIAAVEKRGAKVPPAVEGAALLRGWNGQMEIGLPQPVVATGLHQQIRRMLAEKANPAKGAEYTTLTSAAVIERLLTERPGGWVDDWDTLLVNALADAYEQAKRQQGRNPKKWDWGVVNAVTIAHPVAGRIRFLADYFNIGPVRMSGSSYTVKQTTRSLGPSMRFVADLSDWDRSLMNLTIGESGHRLSGHYKDQWAAYYFGKSFPLPFRHVEAADSLTLQPR